MIDLSKLSKPIRIGIYVGFSLFALLVNFYFTFPSDAVAQRLQQEITKATGGKYTARIAEVDLYRLSGFEAEGVSLKANSGNRKTIAIDAVRGRLNLLPLLWFNMSFDAEVELGDAVIEADIDPEGGGAMDLSVEIEDLNFSAPPILPKLLGTPFTGLLAAKANMEIGQDVRKSTGQASITIKQASFGPAQLKGISIPRVNLGQLDLAVDLRGGRARVLSFTQKGGDVVLKADASSTLRPRMGNSVLDLCFQLKANEDFLDKNPKMKSAVELAQVQFRKDGEGFLHVPLKGTMSSIRPSRSLCKRKGSRGGNKPRAKSKKK